MTRLMPYTERFADVPRALEVLRHHPGGLALSTLAARLGVDRAALLEELSAFFLADVADEVAGIRSAAIEFLAGDGTVSDAAEATLVRLTSDDPLSELGVELLDAGELGVLWRVSRDLSRLEPDNEVLARTVRRLGETLVPAVADTPDEDVAAVLAADLRAAIGGRRRVEILYARAWEPGVTRRTVDPYRLTSTRRGYELDAGAGDRGGALRTFLISHIRQLRLLDETFERPADVDARIARARATTPVRLVVPAGREWAVERFSERWERTDGDDDDVVLVAHVVPPVADRVGLMLTVAGPGAMVLDPADLADADARIARDLLAHHGLA